MKKQKWDGLKNIDQEGMSPRIKAQVPMERR
ncbi:unknown [Prevotella sp. CAG:1320]|nr:unknown [Prevotella sp. CAG:1320]